MRKFLRNRSGFVDPKVIISVVVALMFLAVGVFAFFTVTSTTNQQTGGVSGTRTVTETAGNPHNLTGLPTGYTNVTNVVGVFSDGSTVTANTFVWTTAEPTAIRWINVTGG